MKYIVKLLIIIASLLMVGCGSSNDKPATTPTPSSNNSASTSSKTHDGAWTPYADSSGRSNILSYRIGSNYIDVQFKSGKKTIYRYSYNSAGRDKVEEMKRLARNGQGLNGYINRNARKLYEK